MLLLCSVDAELRFVKHWLIYWVDKWQICHAFLPCRLSWFRTSTVIPRIVHKQLTPRDVSMNNIALFKCSQTTNIRCSWRNSIHKLAEIRSYRELGSVHPFRDTKKFSSIWVVTICQNPDTKRLKFCSLHWILGNVLSRVFLGLQNFKTVFSAYLCHMSVSTLVQFKSDKT